MKQVKFGAIFMVSIMGLAAVGVSYAHWEETLLIEGIMYTDDIDPAFYFAMSNDPCIDGFMADPWECGLWDEGSETIQGWHGARKDKNVGCTDVEILPDPDTGEADHVLSITINDAYPCYYTHPYFEIVNYGSVPVNLYSFKLTEVSFDPDPYDAIPRVFMPKNVDLNQAGWKYYVRWLQNATGVWYAQVRTNVSHPENWDFSIERTDSYEMGTQLDPWRWGHLGDGTIDPSNHIPENEYVDMLYGDLCIHFLNGCEQLALYDFKLELVFWNWPEGGEGCELPEDGIGCNGDIMLTLDTSGSINPTERGIAADAAKGFVDILMLDNAQVGVVNFSDNGHLQLSLSNDHDLINNTIDAVYAPFNSNWLTNLYEGINLSRVELNTNDRDDADYKDYMVIITDGVPTTGPSPYGPEALAEANRAKADGITIFVVGVGVDATGEAYCRTIATDDDHYFGAADWEDLADILALLINCPNPGT
jgi:uncharacterized protein YegL